MLSKEAIKFRAVKMGIATGEMPDVEFVWSVQRAEGVEECFGQGLTCQQKKCRWRKECVALDFFADSPIAVLSGESVESREEVVKLTVGKSSTRGKYRQVGVIDDARDFRKVSKIRCIRKRRDPHVERDAAQARTFEPAGGGSDSP
ncbi:MAG: hypothetical protein JXD22_02835 [Sedimentisphaerales bacterium]|nr:hypothetical protein [Sedimentisphaerales bacterium]